MDAVLHAAANTAEDFPGGIAAMAEAVGKTKFSLYHELSGTGTAKLGLVTAVKMVRRSSDPRILNAFAAECGYLMVPLPDALMGEGSDVMRDLGQVAKEFAEVVHEVTAATADGEVSANELARLERQWSELVAAGQQMMGRMRARHEAGKPAIATLKAA